MSSSSSSSSSSKLDKKAARIHQAVANGDDCLVIDLTKAACFKLSSVVDARDPTTGATPLLTAAERGDAGIAKILLGRGADVHATDNLTRTAVHIGTLRQHAQFLELIVRHGANLEATTKDGLTPLMLAIEQQQVKEKESTRADGVRFLLEKNVNIKGRTVGGLTPFLRAVALHRLAVVKVFLTATKGGTAGGGKKGGKEGGKEGGVLGVGVRVLGVDEDRDLEGRTGFMLAVAGGDLVMAELLLEMGADIEAKDKEGKTALMRVVEEAGREGGKEGGKEREVVEFLLKHGGSLKASVKEGGVTPLLLAAMQGNKTMVELLLANGADIDEKDTKEYTPLMHAAEKGHTDLVKYLMEKGAPVITPAEPTSVTARRSNSNSWMDRSLGSQSGASSLNASTSTSAAAATAAALHLPPSTPLSRIRLSASIQSLGQSGQGQTPRKLTAEDVAATEEIKSLVRRALNCGPPVLPHAPEVRKEKLDPTHPSILLAFAPPVPTAATPKLGALKYGAECFVVEEGGEEGREEKPVAVLEGLSSGQSPFVFRGLERSKWYVFKVYAEAVGGRGMASTSEPVFLATAPIAAPTVKEVVMVEGEEGGREEQGEGGVGEIMEEETEMAKGEEVEEEEGEEGVQEEGVKCSSVRVVVDAPSDDGGAPITSYVLTAKPGSFKVESETTTLLLPGLVKGKSYNISVAGKNAVGQGPFSRVVSHDVAL